MKLAIICAMEEELAAIEAAVSLNLVAKLDKASNSYAEYKFGEHTIILVVSGIGKVNAAVTTQILIDNFAPDAIVNVGVAGSLTRDLVFGDVVIATDLVEHDFDITAFGVPLGQIARMDTFSFAADAKLNELLHSVSLLNHQVVLGRIVSGDQFIDDEQKALFLRN